jgi:hypothetical protein
MGESRKLAAILVADNVGYSRLAGASSGVCPPSVMMLDHNRSGRWSGNLDRKAAPAPRTTKSRSAPSDSPPALRGANSAQTPLKQKAISRDAADEQGGPSRSVW